MVFTENLATELVNRSKDFEDALRDRLAKSKNVADNALAKAEVLCFMYFDEAHVLTEEPQNGRTKHHLLGRMLATMNDRKFFAVFLSTNSWLGALAPSPSKFPSLRDWDVTLLHVPFTELPFDTFADSAFWKLSHVNPDGPRLRDMCSLDYIVKFGRPL